MPVPDIIADPTDVRLDHALPVGTTLSGDHFTITGHLGAGGFGITYRATDNVLGREIVIKECLPQDFCLRVGKTVAVRSSAYAAPFRSIVEMFMREARSLARLRHPNIVGVHRAFEENDTAYMVLDLIDGPDLLTALQAEGEGLSPRRITRILTAILGAMETVHDANLLHRDIAPDNIIIEDSGAPVLIDFGAARMDATRHTRAASALLVVKDGYSPPEFYMAGSEQSPSSDLYALAATFYHLVSGEVPPDSQSRLLALAGKRTDPCAPLAGRIDGYDPAFLAALDTAMAIHPGERLQSAAQWRSLIAQAESGAEDGVSPDVLSRRLSQDISLDLERSLTRLVQETNADVASAPVAAKRDVPPVPAREQSRPPEWVSEFNAESLAPERVVDDVLGDLEDILGVTPQIAVAALEDDARPARTVSETNWIQRALEKQERLLEEERLAEEAAEAEARSRKRSSRRRGPETAAPQEELPPPPPRNRVRALGISIGLLDLSYYGLVFYVL